MLLDLDDPAGLDPALVGAKAAWLARGRRAGLPVLPGVVVTVDAGREATRLGASRLASGGSGSARLAVATMPVAPELLDALPGAVAALGPELVVRSSSPLEHDGAWAGAFTSYLDATPETLPTAIRGCWASAFSNGALRRADQAGVSPEGLRLAVLIQPAVAPRLGGSARLAGEAALVVAVRGSPAPLLQGWDPGVHGRVRPDGSIDGAALAQLVGARTLSELAATLRRAEAMIGATACEWAVVEDRLVIFQLGWDGTGGAAADATGVDASGAVGPLSSARAEDLEPLGRIARVVRHAPGELGETLVLPWALAGGRDLPTGGGASAGLEAIAPHHALAEALDLAADLTVAAWRDVGDRDEALVLERARAAVTALRGPDPVAAVVRLASRPAAEPARAERLLGLLSVVRHGLVAAGAATDADEAWHLTPGRATEALDAGAGLAVHSAPIARRPRLDAWQPFQVAVILATGLCRSGVASGPGLGAGRLTVVDDALRPDGFRGRDVILARRPIPHLAPLLWDATAVVTAGGGPGAHLFESARALGLPAVSGIGLDDLVAGVLADGPCTWAMAVDGSAGVVAVTPW